MNSPGVILVNTGTPLAPTSEAVRAYLREFLMDPRICPMNPALWRFTLDSFVLPRRAPASTEKYKLIWTDEGSPLAAAMGSLAYKVNAGLEEAKVVHALTYSQPSVRDSLEVLKSAGCDRVVVVPLYPQSAHSTTKAVEGQIQHELVSMEWTPSFEVIDGYSREATYLDAIAGSIKAAGMKQQDRLFMAFHSIPMRDVEAGDTYGVQVVQTAEAIAERLHL